MAEYPILDDERRSGHVGDSGEQVAELPAGEGSDEDSSTTHVPCDDQLSLRHPGCLRADRLTCLTAQH